MKRVLRTQKCKRTGFAVASVAAIGLVMNYGSAIAAEPVDRLAVTAVKPLLLLAVERGEAHGLLQGRGADTMHRRFAATTPIEIDVRRLHHLAQPGCDRLEVTTQQQAVLESGTRHDTVLTYQVSYCRDGHFPEKR